MASRHQIFISLFLYIPHYQQDKSKLIPFSLYTDKIKTAIGFDYFCITARASRHHILIHFLLFIPHNLQDRTKIIPLTPYVEILITDPEFEYYQYDQYIFICFVLCILLRTT